MFSLFNLEDKIQANEKKFLELSILLESLETEERKFHQELGVSAQEIENYASDPQNFTHEEWEKLQKQKKEQDDKLQLDLDNIRNPIKAKKKLNDFHLSNTWLHVR